MTVVVTGASGHLGANLGACSRGGKASCTRADARQP